MFRSVFIMLLALAGPAHLAAAETITVCAKGCDYTSINAAIAAASDGDVIQLAAETYYEGEVIDTLGKAITLRGVLGKSGELLSVIHGNRDHRVLKALGDRSALLRLDRLLITGGVIEFPSADGLYGGMGLYASGVQISVLDCEFQVNSGEGNGGAVALIDCSASVARCRFSSNSSGFGKGGALATEGTDLTLETCVFDDHYSSVGGTVALVNSDAEMHACFFRGGFTEYGGALYSSGSLVLAADCTFQQNLARFRGGGIFSQESTSTFRRCLFLQNKTWNHTDSPEGGGLAGIDSSLTFEDCVFSGNESFFYGGAVWVRRGEVVARSTRFEKNSAIAFRDCYSINSPGLGGGIYSQHCDITLESCVFEGNRAYASAACFSNAARPGEGAAVCIESGTAAFLLTTFSGNVAELGTSVASSMATVTMDSCVLAECCQVDPPRSVIDLGGNDYDSWCDDCRANIDCRNDAVDAEDLGYLLARWGTDDPQSDIDGDGLVTASDLGFLFASWGPCK